MRNLNGTPSFRVHFQKEFGKSVRADVEEDQREMVSSECDMALILMNSQPLCLSAEDLQWATPANTLS